MRHLLHVYPTFAVGGAQMRLSAILNHFGRRWRHSIIALNGDTACRERLGADLLVAYPELVLPKGSTFGNIRRIRHVLRELRPDMVVTSNWGSIEWAMANRGLGIGHLHVEDGFGPEERDRQLPRRVWTRRVCLAGRNVVVPSRTLERIALGVWRLAPRLVAYIPNGIDLARFGAAPERHGGLVIGTVATLRAEKNLGRLLRAFAALDAGFAARLMIVGDGPERGALEALAGSLGIAGQVEFVGHQPDPSRFYGGFDVFALSSDTEQMPLSVLEAMAAGLPVVATEVGDVRAMIAPANARWLCERNDGALAAVLADAIGDAVARGEIGAANRRKAEQDYVQEKMFSAYAALFDGAPIPAAAPRSSTDPRR
jgi:glycosyltransferase involved in cell wall biosynthesis